MIFGRFKFIAPAAAGRLHWPRLPGGLRCDFRLIYSVRINGWLVCDVHFMTGQPSHSRVTTQRRSRYKSVTFRGLRRSVETPVPMRDTTGPKTGIPLIINNLLLFSG
jgi:hypothetical protein